MSLHTIRQFPFRPVATLAAALAQNCNPNKCKLVIKQAGSLFVNGCGSKYGTFILRRESEDSSATFSNFGGLNADLFLERPTGRQQAAAGFMWFQFEWRREGVSWNFIDAATDTTSLPVTVGTINET